MKTDHAFFAFACQLLPAMCVAGAVAFNCPKHGPRDSSGIVKDRFGNTKCAECVAERERKEREEAERRRRAKVERERENARIQKEQAIERDKLKNPWKYEPSLSMVDVRYDALDDIRRYVSKRRTVGTMETGNVLSSFNVRFSIEERGTGLRLLLEIAFLQSCYADRSLPRPVGVRSMTLACGDDRSNITFPDEPIVEYGHRSGTLTVYYVDEKNRTVVDYSALSKLKTAKAVDFRFRGENRNFTARFTDDMRLAMQDIILQYEKLLSEKDSAVP